MARPLVVSASRNEMPKFTQEIADSEMFGRRRIEPGEGCTSAK